MSFSMPVRSKTFEATRRRRLGWTSHEHQAGSASAVPEPAQRNLRHGGPCQDRALYSCSCGYAFDAPVSTSVDCPHCGDRQAW
jgi:hypothetical protein